LKKLSFSFVMLFLSALTLTSACTYFTLPQVDGEYVVGRAMEFMEAFPSSWWLLKTHPVESNAFATKYGYIGVSARIPASYATKMGLPQFLAKAKNMGKLGDWANLLDMTSEGMNTEGLAASALVFSQAKFQERQPATDHRIQLPYMELLPFILGRYATVNETLHALRHDVLVYNPYPTLIPSGYKFHYGLADAQGDHAIVEYLNGELSVTLNGVGVLTNQPDYNWHLRNLNNFVHLNPSAMWVDPAMQVNSNTEVGVVPRVAMHGQNLLGLPGDYTPAGRFVRTFYLRQIGLANQPPSNIKESIDFGSALLDNVRIIHGTVTNERKAPALADSLVGRLSGLSGYDKVSGFEFTSWNTLKLPRSRTFIFRTFENSQWKAIHLPNLYLGKGAEPKTIPMFDGSSGIRDFTQALH